jgi:hypothetical protein
MFGEHELIVVFARRNFQPDPYAKEVSLPVGPSFASVSWTFKTQSLNRSRAVQINMNMSVLEEWVGQMGLPRGVQSHLAPVRDLLNWLQVFISLSNISSSFNCLLVSFFHYRLLESGRYHPDFLEH